MLCCVLSSLGGTGDAAERSATKAQLQWTITQRRAIIHGPDVTTVSMDTEVSFSLAGGSSCTW
eukprot:1550098-Rhodomonas_salina.1